MEKKDHYIEVFMGTTYIIGKPNTIGQLKNVLEQIIKDLPKDEELEVSEVILKKDRIEYFLVNGINQ